ncbi:unnamed protein product, partial [Discosporangium mesarthrocarpum]
MNDPVFRARMKVKARKSREAVGGLGVRAGDWGCMTGSVKARVCWGREEEGVAPTAYPSDNGWTSWMRSGRREWEIENCTAQHVTMPTREQGHRQEKSRGKGMGKGWEEEGFPEGATGRQRSGRAKLLAEDVGDSEASKPGPEPGPEQSSQHCPLRNRPLRVTCRPARLANCILQPESQVVGDFAEEEVKEAEGRGLMSDTCMGQEGSKEDQSSDVGGGRGEGGRVVAERPKEDDGKRCKNAGRTGSGQGRPKKRSANLEAMIFTDRRSSNGVHNMKHGGEGGALRGQGV